LFPPVRISLDRATRGARDDDPPSAHPDSGADGREQERETFLAEGSLERRRHAHVVAHSKAPRQLDITARATCVALERLGLRESEQGRHAFERDPPFHAAVTPLRHSMAEPCGGIKSFLATNL